MAKEEASTPAVENEMDLGQVLQLMSSQLAVGNQLASQIKTLNTRINGVQAKIEHMSPTTLAQHFSKDNVGKLKRTAEKTLKELQEALEAADGQEKFLNVVLSAPIDAPPIAQGALEQRAVTEEQRKVRAEAAVRGRQ